MGRLLQNPNLCKIRDRGFEPANRVGGLAGLTDAPNCDKEGVLTLIEKGTQLRAGALATTGKIIVG